MIDIFTIRKGDKVEYQCYICSESLRDKRYYGIYQDYTFWSPDGRQVEMWLELIGLDPSAVGLRIGIRASQVTNVYRDRE